MRTVVEVLLAVLVAPVAEAKVLDRPRQLRGRRRKGQELTDDLEWLAGRAVNVDLPGSGFDHYLTTGGWRPEPVPLTRPHPSPSYSRGRTPAASPECRQRSLTRSRRRVGSDRSYGVAGGSAAIAHTESPAGRQRSLSQSRRRVDRAAEPESPACRPGPLSELRGRAAQPPDLPADGLDRVPPLKVWPNRWDASPR
jgi:hypothetical protein